MSRAHLLVQCLLFLGLAGLLALELERDFTGERSSRFDSAPQYRPESLQLAAVEIPTLEALAQTTRRPLFNRERRPPVEEPPTPQAVEVVEAPPPPEITNYVLSAIVIVDDRKAVLLTDPRNGQLTKRTEGEVFSDGWALDEIRADSVVLSHSGETREVPLRRFDTEQRGVAADKGRQRAGSKAGTERAARELKIREQQLKKLQERLKKLQQTVNEGNQPATSTLGEESCGLSRC